MVMRIAAFAAACSAVAAAAFAAPWTLDELVDARRPHPAELEVEQRLRQAERRLAASAGLVREGVTLSAEAGPRRAGGETESDTALAVDLPIWTDGAARRAAVVALRSAAPKLRAAAAAEAEREIGLAAVAVWAAAERDALAADALAVVERWRSESGRRIAAGAEAEFEATLVAGELERSRFERAEAAAEVALARARLAALVTMPLEEAVVAPPTIESRIAESLESRFAAGAPRLAARADAELVRAIAALDAAAENARFGLAGSVAREGEEEVARLGVAYRFPLPGETRAIAARRDAETATAARLAERAEAELAARFAAALARLAAAPPALDAAALDRAERAIELRWSEGRSRVAELVPLRRALLDARRARIDSRLARAEAQLELRFLTQELTRDVAREPTHEVMR